MEIEAHTDMTERLVGYLAVEEVIQMKIESTLEHTNQSYAKLCFLSDY